MKKKNANWCLSTRRFALSASMALATVGYGWANVESLSIPHVENHASVLQTLTINGKVIDQNGNPVIGANVLVKGTTNGSITDLDGNFSLNVEKGATLAISYIGYKDTTIKITSAKALTITLKEDSEALEEVVVVGYGTQKKVNLTGAVGSVKPDDLGDIQTNSVSSMIKGHLSGVQITQNNGAPGAGSKIRIRGVGTLGNDAKNNPLLVVDGQAVDYGIETLDPNDIESVSVLKDASSAAIYGSRAANGVILLTTKRGKEGKGKVSVNAYVSVQTMMKNYEMLDVKDYLMLQNEACVNAKKNPVFTNDASFYGAGTDWVDAVTQLGTTQEYNVNFSQATDKTNYYMSGTYYTQRGLVNNTGYDRASFRFNGDAKINSKLKVGNSVTLTWNQSFGNSNALGFAMTAPPTMPVKNEDGTWGVPDEAGEGGLNPAYFSELAKADKSSMWRALANMYAEYQIIDGLKFKVTGAIDFAANNNRNYFPRITLPGEWTEFSDQVLYDNMRLGYTWQNDYLLYFNKDFSKHHIDAMAGFSMQASQKKDINGEARGFLTDEENMQILGAGQRDWRATGGLNRWSMVSYLGNINYNYDSRYLASFNIRVDGSSRFGKNNRYGVFPSGSLAWRIRSEEFMEDIDWISNLKLRASYGSLGNQEIGLYSFADQLDVNQWYLFGDGTQRSPGVSSVNLIDPNIKWETTTITNIGIDLGLFNNTLSMVAEYYIKNTKDILLGYPIPSTVGKGSPTVNAGKVRNSGFEMELRYNNSFGDLWMNAAVIYGYNHNEVTDLLSGQEFLNHEYAGHVKARSAIGHPINSIYGFIQEGVYQTEEEVANSPKWGKAEPGHLKFKDLNNDGVINDEDRTYIGKAMPHSTLGVNLNMKYKNWDFSMFWQGDFGKDLFWGLYGGKQALSGFRNVNKIWLNRWHGPGTSNEYPAVVYGREYQDISTFQMEDADYFRLKNISLGYTFKFKNKMQARVYLAGQNLLTLTPFKGIDPEIASIAEYNSWGDSYPQPRTYTLGVNLNF